jgi:hypothetical protein
MNDTTGNPFNPLKPKEGQLALFRKPESLFNDAPKQSLVN